MSQISAIALLLVLPAVLAGNYFGRRYTTGVPVYGTVTTSGGIFYPGGNNPIPVRGIAYTTGTSATPPFISGGVFYPGGNNDTPRIPGYLGPNGLFYPGGSENTPAGPGPFIAGSLSPGGIFYPGGNNDTPQVPVPGTVIPQGPTSGFGFGRPGSFRGYPRGPTVNHISHWRKF